MRWIQPTILLTLCNASMAQAHGVILQCQVHPPDRVVVSVLFRGAGPAAGATIRVKDNLGDVVAEGVADGRGQFVFTAKTAVAYSFEATVAGHKVQYQLDSEQVARLHPGVGSAAGAPHPEPTSPATTPRKTTPRAGHEHTPFRTPPRTRPDNVVEVLAGLAVILSLAAFVMTCSMRRRLRAHLDHEHKSGE